MGTRGRKSTAEMAISPKVDGKVLLPPEGMNQAETDVWLDVVRCLPPEFIAKESAEMLANYCRHAVSARDLSIMIDRFNPKWLRVDGGLARYERLMRMRAVESRALLACARSLRLTAQSRVDPKTAGRARRNGLNPSFYDLEADKDDGWA
ncbi:MAG: hypothetical protein E5V62_02975 [Mesorhizobium sp.]|uniref:hypothetical protein n=1 Tax=Mesorhizobium sp. TaxID=1871066 RepID=UPI000FD18F22|nr:hypothetical protein [Mesorhizobium sp.]RVD72933.1 hypothetical protein EN751_07560 [Mesorhizobium sp. M4A.F.Ca.ET.029.04.2.1]TIW37128.1 MAG: hypothetical protein E5V62_02975 [Mesorhizobium sp.]